MVTQLLSREPHTSKIDVVGTFRYKKDAERMIEKTLIPLTGREVIYSTRRF